MEALIAKARFRFHEKLFETNTLTLNENGVASNADTSSKASKAIAKKIIDILETEQHHEEIGDANTLKKTENAQGREHEEGTPGD